MQDQEPGFFSPEMAQGWEDVLPDQIEESQGWDIAIRYHEFKSVFKSDPKKLKKLRQISAFSVLERAKQLMGSLSHPARVDWVKGDQVLPKHYWSEVDFEEMIEDPETLQKLKQKHIGPEDFIYQVKSKRQFPLVIAVDTSLSMTGQKLALTAVALAIVLLEFDHSPIGIVAFENEATVIKMPFEPLSVFDLVQKFLDVPAQGYTHLEEGMVKSLELGYQIKSSLSIPVTSILLTDGKYTAGKDPAYLAPRFENLMVIKMGEERASHLLCLELAQKGHGQLSQVSDLQNLPTVMYQIAKSLRRC